MYRRIPAPAPLAAAAAILGTLLVGCADAQSPAKSGCAPLETSEPNATDSGRRSRARRAPAASTSNAPSRSTVVAKGLDNPWAVEPLPGGDFLVTEKPGRLRIVSAARADRRRRSPACRRSTRAARAGCSMSRSARRSRRDRTIYWSYTEPRAGRQRDQRRARRAVERPAAARAGPRDLPRAADLRRHDALRLASRVRAGRHAVRDDSASAPTRGCGRRRSSSTATSARSCASRPTARRRATTRSSGRRGALPEIWSLGHRNVQAARLRCAGPAVGGRARRARRRRAEPDREGQELRLAGGDLRPGVLRARRSRAR